jgi:hypothetical protein
MKKNIYKKIIEFSKTYKMQILILIIVPQIIFASYNYYNNKDKCLSFVEYSISSTIKNKLSMEEMYKSIIKEQINDLEIVNNQFIIKNDNSDMCDKIIKEILTLTEQFNSKVEKFIKDNKNTTNVLINDMVHPLLFLDLSSFNTVKFVKIVEIKNKLKTNFVASKLILVSFLFSILLIILFFLKKNINSFRFF